MLNCPIFGEFEPQVDKILIPLIAFLPSRSFCTYMATFFFFSGNSTKDLNLVFTYLFFKIGSITCLFGNGYDSMQR